MLTICQLRRLVVMVTLGTTLVGAMSVSGAAAAPPTQPPAGGVPQLVEQDIALSEQILDAVTKLQESVDALSTANQANFRVTPPVFANAADENIGCDVVNVSNASRTVVIELRNVNGVVVNSKTSVLDPGRVDVINSTPIGLGYCRFTVSNGTRADIRGAFIIGALTRNILSVPAE